MRLIALPTTNLAPLQNMRDELKAHMSKHHRLGDAKIDFGLLQLLDETANVSVPHN